MKKLLSLLGSMKTMALLMSIFAFAIGYATFIENDYGTITAKAEVYNALWFEILLGLLTINLIYNIIHYKMYKLKKAPLFIFHTAFIIIIIGAAITRYFGFEGTMHIREQQSASTMLSADTFFSLEVTSGEQKEVASQSLYLSKRSTNSISSSLDVDQKSVHVELLEYIPDAVEQIVEVKEGGRAIAEMMVTDGGQGSPLTLKEGEFYQSENLVLDFNSGESFDKEVISLFVEEGVLYMRHPMDLEYLKMDDGSKGVIQASQKENLATRTLFSAGTNSFVLRDFVANAEIKIVTNPNASPQQPGYDAFHFLVDVEGEQEEMMIYGRAGNLAKPYTKSINGVDVTLSYGSKELDLPFAIYLEDFQLDRYPGSMSPASYASEVVLHDQEQNINMPYRIYMNNILEHRGYRFFQASYDQDEKGTVLSVNNDPGTLPSYIGYFLLGLGMFWSLFSKQNRFAALAKKAKKASEEKFLSLFFALGILGLLSPFGTLQAQELHPALQTIVSFDAKHSQKFGELVVQDSGGRMKPLHTLATEILSKVHKSATLKVAGQKLDASQVILGMMIRPDIYRDIKLIQTKNEEINKIIGAPGDAKYCSFSQFFEDPENMRGYKLYKYTEEASRKEPKHRSKLDNQILKIDEKVNIVYMVFTGELVRIWPKHNDIQNKWFATMNALRSFDAQEGEKLRLIAVEYFSAIDNGLASGEWNNADKALQKIAEYQKFYGAEVYPSPTRIKAEVFYNEANIFERLYPLYLIVGFILLIFSFIKVLRPKFKIDFFTKTSLALLILFFVAHTIGLALRWYISGHAPWSDGYESMIYIGWATVLAGFIFSKRSSFTMASTGILTGLILFVAHLNWMDPQVTNLVPVLNSYWLSIHVSMITASYGFLGLGALLGFIVLLLFILKNQKNHIQISASIKELNAINEMSLMIGLVLLTIGNFLGGVWANESWGRYWGWDPKETWALVTILVYAVVVHLRFIKAIYNDYVFSAISLLAFTSVLMTYFGVNYYLAGLHSYAKGDPVPVPDFVPITYFIIFVVIALAFRNRKLA
ncbi:MAG: cytochrome c biogenesis protein CcsA [Sulfurimonas sp.]|jgi:cytochrome c-type biogenesis protein CcsB|nr:cytochrome c biogenesis protein CcsA [Sulfurimonas sp.]